MRSWIRTKLRLLTIAGCLLGLLLAAQTALAHPADMLFQYHQITLTQSGMDIEWSIYPGYLLVPRTWNEADANGDGQVTSQEADIWAEQRLSYLSAQIDSGGPIPLRITAVQWPSSLSTFQVGQEVITISLAGTLPHLAPGSQHAFSLHNQYQENNSIYGFDIQSDAFQIEDNQKTGGTFTAAFTAQAVQATPMGLEQMHSQTDAPGPVAEMLLSPPAQVDSKPSPEAASQTEVVKQSAVASLGSGNQLGADTASQPAVILAGLVSSSDLSPGFYLLALAISLALGALHALTPGHGKTIVAAYLVGVRGTVRHAVILGGITTLTHTGSVLLIGVATLVASRYFIPTAIFPVLEITSGILIAGLGLGLLLQRWHAWRSGGAAHSHEHDDHHSHPHSHGHKQSYLVQHAGRPKTKGRLQIRAPSGHHHHNIPEIVTWRSLVGLGISGGLVPCPDAIAILLVAVAIHRIVLGLALILAFSFGLALVLIAIGVAIVHGTHFLSRFDSFEKVAPVLPVISAVVVTLLGAFLTVNAVQSQTATGQAQNVQTAAPALAPTLLSATAPPKQEGSIVYLTLDANGYSQLAQVAPTGGDPTILTTEPYGVRDYTIDPASRRIIYSAWRSDGGSDLWYLALDGSLPSRLLACRQSACSSPIWLPGLSRLIYLLQYIPLPGGAPGAMAVWSLDTTTGETRMLPVADNALGVNPQLSPDGHWLAYETLPSQSLRVVALDRMESIDVENTLGGNKAWRPDSRALVMTGVVEVGGQYSDGLWSIDPASGDHIGLTAAPEINDRMPMWSPDGERLAFVRYVQIESGDTEAQVWLVTRDGKDAHPVVSGQPYAFDRLGWSPDGRTLLAEARLLTGERTIPSLWRIDVSTGQITRLVRPGSMATWTP